MTTDFITVVSGLPRSGTSMMMRMLAAGGISALTDGDRRADHDNPHGYFELEAVKRTSQDPGWLGEATGKVVKVISELIPQLPAGQRYKVVFMRRQLDEVLASQKKMLVHRAEHEAGAADDQAMKELFVDHLGEIEAHLRERDDVEVLFVSYNRTLAEPAGTAARVARFLGVELDQQAMAAAVDPALYRNRAASNRASGTG